MQLGYKVEPTNSAGGSGGEDKSFLASKLLLIPRAQNRVKLSYASRCAVDMWFLDVSTGIFDEFAADLTSWMGHGNKQLEDEQKLSR